MLRLSLGSFVCSVFIFYLSRVCCSNCRNLILASILTLFSIFAIALSASAGRFDPPSIAYDLEGELVGKVRWVHNSTWWFMLDVEEVRPMQGSPSRYDELTRLEQGLKIEIPWTGPSTPSPEHHTYIQSLKPGQSLTIRVRPGGDGKSVRLVAVPGQQVEKTSSQPSKKAAAPFASLPLPSIQPDLRHVDISMVTGAIIDESVVQRTLHVNADSSPGGDGTAAWPFATFAEGLSAANTLLRQGVPVRVLLAPGIYREAGFEVDFPDDPIAQRTPLIIEGNNDQGEVIFSGADQFVNWRDEGEGLWSHTWSHDFGFFAGLMGKHNIKGLLGQRRVDLL